MRQNREEIILLTLSRFPDLPKNCQTALRKGAEDFLDGLNPNIYLFSGGSWAANYRRYWRHGWNMAESLERDTKRLVFLKKVAG